MSRILVNCYIPECQLLLANWGKKFSVWYEKSCNEKENSFSALIASAVDTTPPKEKAKLSVFQ